MPRFFVDKDQIEDNNITITGTDVNHIRSVLRMRPGENITVSDGSGTDYYCSIVDLDPRQVRLQVIDRWQSFSELPVRITLYQGLPKADKMDLIVRKCVELGVFRIVPVITSRTVSRPEPSKLEKKRQRWQGISESAAKQAGRAVIPELAPAMTFRQALQESRSLDTVLMPYEKAAGMDAARTLVHGLGDCRSAGILIGPEGGFADEEVEAAQAAGIKTISLGHRILRTETAGMAVMSILMFELEKD